MKTSSFFHFNGPGRVSIARSAPRKISGYKAFRLLAPGPWFKINDQAQYRDLYFQEILKPLDPQEVHDRLHQLAGEGNEPVLLCWEALTTPEDWCHRRMAAEWFEDKLGIEVAEIGPMPKPKPESALQGALL